MPMVNFISIVCSGDCYWFLMCSSVLGCSGIFTNRCIACTVVVNEMERLQ